MACRSGRSGGTPSSSAPGRATSSNGGRSSGSTGGRCGLTRRPEFRSNETRAGPSATNRVTITAVERDNSAIRVNYDVVPSPDLGSHRARGEAKDDLGNDYCDLGSSFGITGSIDSTDRANTRAHGRLKMPLPPAVATKLRIRISWDASLSSMWEGPAYEVRRLALGLIETRKSARLGQRPVVLPHRAFSGVAASRCGGNTGVAASAARRSIYL
jgi:hypothetical protein